MMRIAIFTDTYAPEINGVARTLEKLTCYLRQNDIEFRVFAPDNKERIPAIPHIERFASLPLFLYPECRFALLNPLHLKQSLEEFKPTLIHVATPLNLGLYGAYYGKKHQIPMVASYHTHFDQYLTYYNLTLLKQWIWKYMAWFHRPFSKVYVPSESTRESLVRKGVHDRIELWKRGVDHTLFTPAQRGAEVREKYQIKQKHILLFVGRLAPEKDVELAIQTFTSLPQTIKQDSHLLIVGDGPLLKPLSTQICSENITFTRFLEGEELAKVYAASDVFLFPSATETFGNVVLEAMSSGIPVVCANTGGVKHLIQHGETGLMCKEKDLDSFVSAVTFLLTNPITRLRWGSKPAKMLCIIHGMKSFEN
ncbi:glycosyltransferase family 4 protein [Halalkalibacter krulwichiae]|uniref:GDP-mannose-dependent alpha-mannosyltransferase n=1 Tax=Halalkalibacter krulwichiae TaxID=199441 RepID=A0A1X9MEC8_9BACI|nr:glycosyltransferase family 1 protein [Halalkalibacter krulwichiae]ARK31795.1 GDP-mannose-dependent alpha-mannosyltransferase [Halalkalibacter krulwichiae]